MQKAQAHLEDCQTLIEEKVVEPAGPRRRRLGWSARMHVEMKQWAVEVLMGMPL